MATLRKILLVDDDDDLREALSEQLVMTEDFDVFEARTITALMDAHPATFIAHIDGLAASAASFIAARADEVEIADGAFVMIHNAWTMAMGDRHDFLDQAALLEKVDRPVATNPDPRLRALARERGWRILDLFPQTEAHEDPAS